MKIPVFLPVTREFGSTNFQFLDGAARPRARESISLQRRVRKTSFRLTGPVARGPDQSQAFLELNSSLTADGSLLLHLDYARANGGLQRAMVAFGLVGIGGREFYHLRLISLPLLIRSGAIFLPGSPPSPEC